MPGTPPRITVDGKQPLTEFTASYDGECVCGAEICEGDVVAYIDGDLSCQDCIRDYHTHG